MSNKNQPSTDVDDYLRALRSNTMHAAIQHISRFNALEVAVLRTYDFVKEDICPTIDTAILEIIEDNKHSCRIVTSPGPIIFYRDIDQNTQTTLIYVNTLFVMGNVNVRAIAYNYFMDYANHNGFISAGTMDILREQKKDLLNNYSSGWEESAIIVTKAIDKDWLCNLAAIRQCYEKKHQQGVNAHVVKAMRPTIDTIEKLAVKFKYPKKNMSDINSFINNIISNATSFEEAANEWYSHLGHLPVNNSISIDAICEVIFKEQPSEVTWEVMWGWADCLDTPLPRYHLCQYFMSNPDSVPSDKKKALWDEIFKIIGPPPTGEDIDLSAISWQVRCQLARYFINYLEILNTNQDGEILTTIAWFLADRMSTCLAKDIEAAKWLLAIVTEPELERVDYISLQAQPSVAPSLLWYGTKSIRSIWCHSLLFYMSEDVKEIGWDNLPEPSRMLVLDAMSGSLLTLFPIKSSSENSPYAFGCSILETSSIWIELFNDSGSRLKCFRDIVAKICDEDTYSDILHGFSNENDAGQLLLTSMMRIRAETDDGYLKELWCLIEDEAWRKSLFLDSSENVFLAIFDTLCHCQRTHPCDKNWAYDLPYFYAKACTQLPKDCERKTTLLHATILSSMAVSNVTAIEFLLNSESEYKFEAEISSYLENIDKIYVTAPRWVQAKLRSLNAVLQNYS